jgi:hypothetical protein
MYYTGGHIQRCGNYLTYALASTCDVAVLVAVQMVLKGLFHIFLSHEMLQSMVSASLPRSILETPHPSGERPQHEMVEPVSECILATEYSAQALV